MTTETKLDLLPGTLDVMVLQTLSSMGPRHGYSIARRIEQISGNRVMLNQGTIYASLVRLQQRALIQSQWGTSESNRKAKFYSITGEGERHLEQRIKEWHRLSDVMAQMFAATPESIS
ncbi:MAG: PadR family transcriptional regulator [Thermoanaerobaculia bacterium]|nr:PadR family transcriptional regulator [Thermoanaerobaculia bacterium]